MTDGRLPKFDFVTVFHSADLFQMVLQARSFARFVNADLVGTILIIFNETEQIGWQQAVEEAVLPEYGSLRSCVTLLPAARLDPAVDPRGWHGQQVLKLLAARALAADHYVVLDAKNHFIRPITDDCFVDHAGRPLMSFEPVAASLRKYFIASLESFSLRPEDYLDRAASPVTPFVMKRNIVDEMMSAIEVREGQEFSRYFLVNNGLLTEFFLYFGFLLFWFGDPLHIHAERTSGAVTLFRKWPDTPEKFLWAAAKARNSATFCFGVHLGRIPHMSDEERSFVLGIWRQAGLITDADGVNDFLPRVSGAS